MEILKDTIDTVNQKVKVEILKDITLQSYSTWLKYVEDAVIEDNNVIITVANEFEEAVLRDRYSVLLKRWYQMFLKFDEVKIRVKKVEHIGSIENDTLKIKSATQMKEITTSFLAKKINVAEAVQTELKNIFKQIETIASLGDYDTKIHLYDNQCNVEVVEKIISILKENGYIAKFTTFSDESKMLDISWG